MTCMPTTVAQVYGESLINANTLSASDGLRSLADLIANQNNPVENFDKEQLLRVSGKLSTILSKIDLSQYPYTSSRFQQSSVPYTEVADFINQATINIDKLDLDMNTFDNYTRVYPTTFPVANVNVPSPIKDLLAQLEFYYVGNLANTVSGGFCGAFGNVFGKIGQLISLIQLGQSLLDKLKGFDLAYLINQIKEKLKIEILKKMLLDIVDKVKDTLLAQIDGMVSKINSIVNDIKALPGNVYNTLRKKIDDVKAFLSDFTMGNLKDSISNFIKRTISQFEELTPDAIALMLFRFCQFAELIQGFMKSPMDGVRSLVYGVIAQEAIIKSHSLQNTQSAVQAGAVRIDDAQIDRSKRALRDGVNASSRERDGVVPTSITGDSSGGSSGVAPNPEYFLTNPSVTAQQISSYDRIGDNGLPGYATFNDGVTLMHIKRGKLTDCGPGDGWRQVQPKVWHGLMRVLDRVGYKVSINSAYRSPQYNVELSRTTDGVARNSYHTTKLALDVDMFGKTDDQCREFIRIASQEGFTAIDLYFKSGSSAVSFIHIDMRDGRGGGWNNTGRFSEYIKAARADKFRRG
jgi:hypothetical protein